MMRRRSFLAAVAGAGLCGAGLLPRAALGVPSQQMLFQGVSVPKAWASITAMGSSRNDAGRAGSVGSALFMGGMTIPYDNAVFNTTTLWGGSSWSAGGTLTVKHAEQAAAGTSTSAITSSGLNDLGPVSTQVTETYNGTTFTGGTNLPAVHRRIASTGCGGTTDFLLYNGSNNAGTNTNVTRSWNGSAWSTGGNVPVTVDYIQGGGATTAALCVGGTTSSGNTNPGSTTAQTYNGSTWSGASAASITRSAGASCGDALTTIIIGGGYNAITSTEYFTGSAFSTGPTAVVGRLEHSYAGDANTCIAAGGCSSSGNLASAERLQ